MRELGEGQFGKVLLMKAKVPWCVHVYVCLYNGANYTIELHETVCVHEQKSI
jgi:hypothetical protein